MRESPEENREDSRKQEDYPTSTRASNGTSTMQAQFRARAEKKTAARQARPSARSRSPNREHGSRTSSRSVSDASAVPPLPLVQPSATLWSARFEPTRSQSPPQESAHAHGEKTPTSPIGERQPSSPRSAEQRMATLRKAEEDGNPVNRTVIKL